MPLCVCVKQERSVRWFAKKKIKKLIPEDGFEKRIIWATKHWVCNSDSDIPWTLKFSVRYQTVCRIGSRASVAKVRFWEPRDSALVSDVNVLFSLAHVLETLQFPHCFHVCCCPSSQSVPSILSMHQRACPGECTLTYFWSESHPPPPSQAPLAWVSMGPGAASFIPPQPPPGIWRNAILYGRVPSTLFFYA